MPAFTPIYAIPYQTLADAPDGPNLGEDGFLVVDSALSGLDVRIDALEAAVKFTKIDERILSGTAASVTFSSIPGTYRQLQVWIACRGDNATTFVGMQLQLNADTGANYDSQQVVGAASSPLASETLAQTSISLGEFAAASAAAGNGGVYVINIPWYASTVIHKYVATDHAFSYGTASSNLQTKQWAGRWRNTAAINSIKLLPSAGNFIAGSGFALYGLP